MYKMEVYEQRDSKRGVHTVQCITLKVQATSCQAKDMLVKLPEESASDPTQQPVKVMWQGKMPKPPAKK